MRISQFLPRGVLGHVALPAHKTSSYSDSKLSCFAVSLLQPWSPLPYGRGCKNASPRLPCADWAAFFAHGCEAGFQEELREFQREELGSLTIHFQKASMPALTFSRPRPVLIIDRKHEKRRPLLPGPDSAVRKLMTSRATCELNSSSGCYLGPLPSSGSEELAATVPAAVWETKIRSLSDNLLSLVLTLPRCPVRAVPRGACLLRQSPPLGGGMLMTPS